MAFPVLLLGAAAGGVGAWEYVKGMFKSDETPLLETRKRFTAPSPLKIAIWSGVGFIVFKAGQEALKLWGSFRG